MKSAHLSSVLKDVDELLKISPAHTDQMLCVGEHDHFKLMGSVYYGLSNVVTSKYSRYIGRMKQVT
ncbi:hypothetical protein KIN20_032409 [Parelaphostrongylus tenuis]|uniref:Uncharacterized protein n=1 Tax=Parelaphostrongylus tenuis TaxID=148309 RepID=A0AAD5R6Y8_PARTN|nr:hypothetical protein KIN20_032409 [Parelaphostrongylus tenuis]